MKGRSKRPCKLPGLEAQEYKIYLEFLSVEPLVCKRWHSYKKAYENNWILRETSLSFWECSWMWLNLPVVILGISVLEFVNSDLNLKTATSLERSSRISFQCQDGDGEWYLLSNSMRFFACNILNLCYLKLIIVDELDKELAPLVRNLIKVAQNT